MYKRQEKYEKKKVTFFSVLTLAILCSIESMLLKFGRYDFIYLVCFAILVAIFSMMLDLSSKVLFTELVDESELEKYNGIRSILDNLSVFGAPMLGTLVYGVFGFSSVILILAILYVLAAVVIAFIPLESKNGGNGCHNKPCNNSFNGTVHRRTVLLLVSLCKFHHVFCQDNHTHRTDNTDHQCL